MRVRSTSKSRESGQAIIIFTLMLCFVLIPIVGLAMDGSRGYLVRLKLSSAVDGASLASARMLGTGADSATQKANAIAVAQQFVKANFPANFFGANLVTGDPYVCVDDGSTNTDPCKVGNGGTVQTFKVRTVYVAASAQMNTWFMRVIAVPTVMVAANGTASRRDVRVVVAIDRSSSMAAYFTGINKTPPSIQDMALDFVKSFSGSGDLGGRDELGLVVFGGSAIVAYPPRDVTMDYTNLTLPSQYSPPNINFKAGGTDMVKLVTDVKANGSNTGTAEALYLAYMMLRADATSNPDLANRLNVIVLFTDGIPNGVTVFANNPDAAPPHSSPGVTPQMMVTPGCTNQNNGSWIASPLVKKTNNNMIGWFCQGGGSAYGNSTGAYGFFVPMMAYPYNGASCSTCTDKGSYTGVGGNDVDAYMKNPDADKIPLTQQGGCSTSGSGTATIIKNQIARFPDYDAYGNYLNLNAAPAVTVGSNSLTPPFDLYKQGDLYGNQCGGHGFIVTSTADACMIALASWQAAAHQAWKIWNQVLWDNTTRLNKADTAAYLPAPVIFTIGFDHSTDGYSEKPDLTLLQLIANDAAVLPAYSLSKRPDKIHGQAYIAKDAGAVGAAFQQIEAEILRLAH